MLIDATTYRNLKNITLSKIKQTQKGMYYMFIFYPMSKKGNPQKVDRLLPGARREERPLMGGE